MTTLRFGTPKNTALPADMVFNQPAGAVEDATITLTATLPAPVLSARLIALDRMRAAATLPPPVLSARVLYDNSVLRGPAPSTRSGWQPGTSGIAIAQQHHQDGTAAMARIAPPWQEAQAQRVATRSALQDTLRCRQERSATWTPAVPVGTRASTTHADMLRERLRRSAPWQNATPISDQRQTGWQDRLRTARPAPATGWCSALRRQIRQHAGFDKALHLPIPAHTAWQETRKPPPGRYRYVVPVVPPERCYTPPLGGNVTLLFQDASGDGNLVFICHRGRDIPATVLVPIRKAYIVINETTLRRVDGDIALPTLAMSLALDVDSWTWTFSATLPGRALPDLEPGSAGEPVLVEAMINGVAYRMQVEKRGRDRTFGQSAVKISGRGLSATLDQPYAPTMNFASSGSRTAQQLMADVLTLNGVGIGWSVDWQAVDWVVPGGLFAHQGTYISALNAIAESAGSYIQSHRVDQTLQVLPRYPLLPWGWGDVTPDFELPASVATVEGIEWIDKPMYNRVFVSGVRDGVLGQVTRAGTAGDLLAPMITDPLISTADAARQRGAPVLSDTGSQAQVSLRLPVLAETGIIVPGKFVRYVDGDAVRIGITRSAQVEVGSPEVWQTIVLETHV